MHSVPISERPLEVKSDFVYVRPNHRYIIVESGYRSDFASIPRFFWRLLPPIGRYTAAAVVHDWLCDKRPAWCSHKLAARIFEEAMADCGVHPIKRKTMVRAVLWFGPKFDKRLK